MLSTRNPSAVWVVDISASHAHLDRVGLGIMVIYLVAVVVLGVFFAARIRDINDYFRGGQRIPWWAAGCSMYATLLSSLTYVALPAVVYRTDWVLYLGICTVLIVTPFVIRVVLPFFRGIDATSAYEYLSMRFNLPVRLLASGLFTAFHIGRMGVVMALTGLALAAVTPLDAWQSVIIMGLLCLVYSAAGGVEGVIWTDTMQVVVLVAGAIGCLVFMIASLDGGLLRYAALGAADGKFTLINPDFSGGSLTTFALWVVVLGGIGQNISSYTADQAVVQRYMTTPDIKSSARSIWVNAIMASLGSLLFFAVGTGLYVFYKTRPGDLDPTVQLDQIFPHFIVSELPNGLAGLAIAGIFAAAQSTISTSINSVSAALVTDFLRPFKACGTERGYFSTARWLTVAVGALGTLAGLLFINDRIRSLLEEYFVVIGISMGALGGLFALGMLTNRANSWGAVIGLLASVSVLVILWVNQSAEGYLFAAIGVCVCVVVGYIASMVFPRTSAADIDGLTIHTSRGAGYGTKLVGRD